MLHNTSLAGDMNQGIISLIIISHDSKKNRYYFFIWSLLNLVYYVLQDREIQEKRMPLPEVTGVSDSGRATPESKLHDSCDASMPKMASTLQFNIKDLMERRQQKLSILQSSSNASGRSTTKRYATLKLKNIITFLCSLFLICNRLVIIYRSYAAATLELSQADNEQKAMALAAATTELERLFRKKDFGRMKVSN